MQRYVNSKVVWRQTYYRFKSTEHFFVDISKLRKFKIVFTQPDPLADLSQETSMGLLYSSTPIQKSITM
jgi:hypothetical protein